MEMVPETEIQDEGILKQQREIEKEVAEIHPLVGNKQPLTCLLKEYMDDPIYTNKLTKLAGVYQSIRRVRPDGNCFFRGFGFSYFERLLDNEEEWKKFQAIVMGTKDQLISQGFPKFTLEDFFDSFMEVVNRLGGEGKMDAEELSRIFNDAGTSDYLVVYLRLVTSGQLQKEEDFYQNFLEGGKSMREFCQQEVEPMYRESDHMHAIALGSALKVGIRVVYLDRGEITTSPPEHDFPEDCTPSVYLLYRPGHYDILYK
ncbi:ubiquitin thioesterase otubain-like [Daphnia pulicaria]|uniref:ubiquitinyl hydrolase 1 n=2 Tax=Daphnia TaxID=6668 RepID=A0A4Y7MUN8_DAPPU|nr:ubiquitin thioesterase otubain-like [Daphnia pulicaria]SVE83805.1 EOG090X0AE1 [Daphnia pulex]SVE85655.1 EOG090X0AE1 [Daphnia pulicaria]